MAKNEDTIKISPAQLKVITAEASRIACEQFKAMIAEHEQANRDKRLYNTKLLLERYRGLSRYRDEAVFDASQIDDDEVIAELFDAMSCGNKSYVMTVDVIQKRAAQVAIILQHVDRMLGFYKKDCLSSHKDEIVNKWKTIQAMYLDEDEKNAEELAGELYVDERTVYRYQKAAIQDLSTLFFGIIVD